MEYVQANLLRLPCISIHTQRKKLIESALLYQVTLEELYVKERPSGGTIHPDHGRDLQSTTRTSRGDPSCEGG
jgi:hypothetical protein